MNFSQVYKSHVKPLLVLGMPIVGSNLAMVLIGFTDVVMLGWYSVEALAAQVLANSFFFVVFLVGSGFGWAVMPMVATHSEAGEIAEIRRVTRMGLWVSVAYGLVFLPLLLSGRFIFTVTGQEQALIPLAEDYLDIVAWALFPALWVMVLRSYLAGLERTQILLWVTIGAAVMNVGLNYVLIFGNFGAPELGVKGAAYASLIVNIVSFAGLAIYVRIVEPGHRLFQRLWRVDVGALRRVVGLGLPICLTTFSETAMFTASAVMIGWLGTIPLAAHGIALQLASLTFVVHLGLSNAATVRTGRAFKRQDMGELQISGASAVVLSLGMSIVAIIAFVTMPELLGGFFIGPHETAREEILVVVTALLLMAAVFQTFDGLQVIALGLLRGLHDTTVPMVYAGISYLALGLPAGYIFGFWFGYGAVGVWAGLVVGLAIASALLLGRFWLKVRKP